MSYKIERVYRWEATMELRIRRKETFNLFTGRTDRVDVLEQLESKQGTMETRWKAVKIVMSRR